MVRRYGTTIFWKLYRSITSRVLRETFRNTIQKLLIKFLHEMRNFEIRRMMTTFANLFFSANILRLGLPRWCNFILLSTVALDCAEESTRRGLLDRKMRSDPLCTETKGFKLQFYEQRANRLFQKDFLTLLDKRGAPRVGRMTWATLYWPSDIRHRRRLERAFNHSGEKRRIPKMPLLQHEFTAVNARSCSQYSRGRVYGGE